MKVKIMYSYMGDDTSSVEIEGSNLNFILTKFYSMQSDYKSKIYNEYSEELKERFKFRPKIKDIIIL